MCELVDFDALVATRDAQMAAIVQHFEHARGRDRLTAPAVDDARHAERLLQLARMCRAVLADVREDALGKARMLALDVPRVADRPRVQQAKRIPWQDAVDMKVLLGERQRRIVLLQVAGAIAADAMPEDQVLGSGRRGDRVELHEAERSHRGFEVARRKKRARDRVIAKLLQGNTGKALAHAARSASTILSRAARAAGRKPPTKPMPSANISAARTMPGVSTKRNASSAKV